MAFDFKVALHWKDQTLHLTPRGDFDGGSAQELLSILKRTYPGASKVYIHTGSLGRIDPFGREVFLKNFRAVRRDSTPVIFTGEKAAQLAPELKNGFVFYNSDSRSKADRVLR